MFKNGLIVIMMMFVMTGFAQEQKKKSKKELKTITYTCPIKCMSCQEKIEHNIAFEKGVKAITADYKENSIIVTFRADKNSDEGMRKALADLGYIVETVNGKAVKVDPKAKAKADAKSCEVK